MSAVDFQLVEDEKIDDSIMKREFIKNSHQSGADFNKENSNISLSFGENYNFIQVGIRFLEFDIKIRKDDNSNFSINGPGHDIIRLFLNAFAFTIHDSRVSSSSGVEIEQNNFFGPISAIMRLITQKKVIYLHIPI